MVTESASDLPVVAESASELPEVAAESPSDLPVVAESPSVRPSASAVSRPPVAKDVSQAARELSALLGRELSGSLSDENGWTDLHYAAVLNLADLVTHLLDEEAASGGLLKQVLTLGMAKPRAAVNAGLKDDGAPLSVGLKSTLRRLGQDFDDWTRDGETPLHVAASVDAREAAVELLAYGADMDAKTPLDWAPLHYAAVANAHNVVDVLQAHGADVTAKVVDDWTPLHLAVWADASEVVAALRARGADVTAETSDGETPVDLSKSDEMNALLRGEERR